MDEQEILEELANSIKSGTVIRVEVEELGGWFNARKGMEMLAKRTITNAALDYAEMMKAARYLPEKRN